MLSSADWGRQLDYSRQQLRDANRMCINVLAEIRDEFQSDSTPIIISGCLGPRGDGYSADRQMTEEDAEVYHREQIETLNETEVDMVSAFTMTYAEEAIGIVRSAQSCKMPVVFSNTLIDVLPSGVGPTPGRKLFCCQNSVWSAIDSNGKSC